MNSAVSKITVTMNSTSYENIDVHIGKKLKHRRTVMGLSQQAVAQGTNLTFQQVQKYEKGINAMNPNRLVDFAKFLDVPVTYFFEGFKAAFPKNSEATNKDDEPSDREMLEIIKAFKQLNNHYIRKQIVDLVRSLTLKAKLD